MRNLKITHEQYELIESALMCYIMQYADLRKQIEHIGDGTTEQHKSLDAKLKEIQQLHAKLTSGHLDN